MKKINIVRWETEAGRQLTQEFGARGIPYVRVYDVEGNFVADGNDAATVQRALK